MPTFLRYLMSLVVHLAWRRAGRSGPIPPVRLPGKKGKHVDLPIIGTWQLMAAMWLAKKVWDRYGHDVKDRLTNHANDLARRAATLLPDPTKPAPFNPATSTAATAVMPNVAGPISAPRAAPNLQTQVLKPQNPTVAPAHQNGAPNPLPSGSVMSKLRGRS